ncbi:MAG: VOC family protein [Actinomycetota bacterium]|nr:VOC family protein [Actinomycetota bacterium]
MPETPSTSSAARQRPALPAETAPGAVRLIAADLDRMADFYERAIGLSPVDRSPSLVRLGLRGQAVVELMHRPDASPRPPGTTGLFHLAILVPNRLELARAIRRVVDAEWSFSGASDHLVSEALYLNDPGGNGIEIYRDRPRDEWRYSEGQLQMATLHLDVDGVITELNGTESVPKGMAPETRIGHVHLQVSDLTEAEDFYCGVLGFDVTVSTYPGALFVSAGGYHHHIGLNTWAGRGAPPPPPGSQGLAWFEIVVPDQTQLEAVVNRLDEAGIDREDKEEGVLVSDPSGNRVLVTSS